MERGHENHPEGIKIARASGAINVPESSSPTVMAAGELSKEYIVSVGETLWEIAQKHNTDVYELAILNQIKSPFRIFVGQRLLISSAVHLILMSAVDLDESGNNVSYVWISDIIGPR